MFLPQQKQLLQSEQDLRIPENSPSELQSETKKIIKYKEKQKKYNFITQNQREQLLSLIVTQNYNLKEAANQCNIIHSTAKAIYKLYKKEGRIGKYLKIGESPQTIIILNDQPQTIIASQTADDKKIQKLRKIKQSGKRAHFKKLDSIINQKTNLQQGQDDYSQLKSIQADQNQTQFPDDNIQHKNSLLNLNSKYDSQLEKQQIFYHLQKNISQFLNQQQKFNLNQMNIGFPICNDNLQIQHQQPNTFNNFKNPLLNQNFNEQFRMIQNIKSMVMALMNLLQLKQTEKTNIIQ